MNGNNLIMFQIFGMVDGMTGLIMGTIEFESLVIFAGDNSELCLTLAAMIQQALESSDPLILSRVVIFGTVQLPIVPEPSSSGCLA